MAEAGNVYRDESPLTDEESAEHAELAKLRNELVNVAKTHEALLEGKKHGKTKKPSR